MSVLRLLAPRMLGASLGSALALVPSVALAQAPAPGAPPAAPTAPPPAAAPPAAEPARSPIVPFRLDIDLYGAVTYRLGGSDAVDLERGGGLLGVSAMAGPAAASWAAGVGYERSFFGKETVDDPEAGTFLKVGRGLDALWFLGRLYPYEEEDLTLYVQLGVAPVWQRVTATGALPDALGQSRSFSCSAGDSAGLGLRAGVGAQLAINDYLGFNTGIGVDHERLSEEPVDGCAQGLGASTFLGARFGFILTAGRARPGKPAPAQRPPPPPSDRDGDGIADAADACLVLAGVPSQDPAKHGCPPPGDADGDRITDEVDACRTVAGVPDQDPAKHGCPPPPPDRDGDKVTDAQDACPDLPGVATSDPATNGCPPDTDGDGIRDDKDACPAVKGAPNEDPAKHGCPLVLVTANEIVIGQQVQFETDRAIIRPVSDPLLDEVAAVIKQHPEIEKIEVQGHTDNSGTKIRNKLLSKHRADAVVKALTKRGVSPKALESNGYGDTEPIADNGTPEGKTKNRRVQFKILQKK